ncbi:MAG TPA: hypothetical protein VMZ27_08555 [Candidatus Saccharimonadales bacterium]|nr:hypothetical protein [Candidatus Saccharimonadales bacterium]
MKPQRYEASPGRLRLNGMAERRGSRAAFSGLGAFLFGTPFVGAGTFIILVGTKTVSVNPRTVHAPYWILTAIGTMFALAGLLIWGTGWKSWRAQVRSQQLFKSRSTHPAFADYPWNPRGFESERWKRSVTAVGVALLLTLFLSGFNYWAFADHGPWPVKIIVGLFDLLGIAAWWRALLLMGRALKFGGSQIAFTSFPYHIGKPVVVHWLPASGIAKPRSGTFTLRCVEEFYETTGTGENRSQTLVHEQRWKGTWFLEQPDAIRPGTKIDLQYEPPEDLPETQLSAARPIFWEFEVKLDLPGLDFVETYLVPIYASTESVAPTPLPN